MVCLESCCPEVDERGCCKRRGRKSGETCTRILCDSMSPCGLLFTGQATVVTELKAGKLWTRNFEEHHYG